MVFTKRFISVILDNLDSEGVVEFIRTLIITGTLLPGEVNDESKISAFAAIISVGDYSLVKEARMRLSELELALIIDLEDVRGKRPLDRAYLLPNSPDKERIVSLLLEEKATVGYNALNLFVSRGNLEMVKLICEKHSVDFSARNSEDKTPLMIAVENEEMEIIEFFIKEKCVDPSVKNKEGENAFDLALTMNFFEVADYLEKKMMIKNL